MPKKYKWAETIEEKDDEIYILPQEKHSFQELMAQRVAEHAENYRKLIHQSLGIKTQNSVKLVNTDNNHPETTDDSSRTYALNYLDKIRKGGHFLF